MRAKLKKLTYNFALKLRVSMEVLKTSYQIEVINRVKNIRVQHGVSQMQLANILNVSNGQIGNIESTKYSHKYTLSQLFSICKHFKINIAQIFLPNESETTIDQVIEKIIEYDK